MRIQTDGPLLSQDIITEGTTVHEDDDAYFVLLDGDCEVLKNGAHLRSIHAPSAFGERALVTRDTRHETIRAASEQVTCLVLKRKTFNRLRRERDHPEFWNYSSLRTQWSHAHKQHLGKEGRIAEVNPGTNEILVEFGDGQQLQFPCGALGLVPEHGAAGDGEGPNPIIRRIDGPSNNEWRSLGILQDWMLGRDELHLPGRTVAVMRDESVARYYFKRSITSARCGTVEDTDHYALTSSVVYFGVAWMLSLYASYVVSALGTVLLLCYIRSSEQLREKRLRANIHQQSHVEWARAIEHRTNEESPQWLNDIIKTAWREMGVNTMVAEMVMQTTNPMLEQQAKPYEIIKTLEIQSMELGDAPPAVNQIQFENSDVHGEMRLNTEVAHDAPNCKVVLRVELDIPGMPVNQVTVTVGKVHVVCNSQLLMRFSSDNLLTLVGIKFLHALGLDYAFTADLLKTVLRFCVQSFGMETMINELVRDSLWWMTDPCMCLLPMGEGWGSDPRIQAPSLLAGSDLPQLDFMGPVGVLDVRIKAAHHLPIADNKFLGGLSDPFVKVQILKVYPTPTFRTVTKYKDLNPVYEHEESFGISWGQSKTSVIEFDVIDEDKASKHDRLGKVEIRMEQLIPDHESANVWQHNVLLTDLHQSKSDALIRKGYEAVGAQETSLDQDKRPCLSLSLRFSPIDLHRRVKMMLSGEQALGHVANGVLRLQVVSAQVRARLHVCEPAFGSFISVATPHCVVWARASTMAVRSSMCVSILARMSGRSWCRTSPRRPKVGSTRK